jgi:hypothetical protein
MISVDDYDEEAEKKLKKLLKPSAELINVNIETQKYK